MAQPPLPVTSHMNRPVPESIPGQKIVDPDALYKLKDHLRRLCHRHDLRFPGSQPVSFDFRSLDLLEKEDFWVCEKSDGVRVLVLIVSTDRGQDVFLIDRKEDFYQNFHVVFPHQDGPQWNHSNTVLDAELVIDVDPATGEQQLRLLAFDCLVIDGDYLMAKSLASRFGRLKNWIIAPYNEMIKRSGPEFTAKQPFQVVLKRQELAYGIEAVFRTHLPSLQHGNDGLIFTSAEAPYTPGTDQRILKWKPPSENSIDFLLQLKFPAMQDNPNEVDWTAKPKFMLMMNHGREGSFFYDTMVIEDAEWETMKESGVQYDDRVVEVVWDKERQTWKMLRFRDDKLDGNYKDVVASIVRSIQDGVEADVLIAKAPAIKKAHKLREAERERNESRARAHARAEAESKAKARAAEQQRLGTSAYSSQSRNAPGGGISGLKR